MSELEGLHQQAYSWEDVDSRGSGDYIILDEARSADAAMR
jgi:hypothetical protein